MSKPKPKVKPLPKTPREWCLYRAKLNCKVAIDAINADEVVADRQPHEYALYCLCNAVSEIAQAIGEKDNL